MSSQLVKTALDCTLTVQTNLVTSKNGHAPKFGRRLQAMTEVSVSKDGKWCKFQSHCLQRYKWLAFSDVQKGAFYKTCMLFRAETEAGKGAHQACKSLMTAPFRKWKYVIETFETHLRIDCHKRATLDVQSFLDVMRSRVVSVHIQLNQQVNTCMRTAWQTCMQSSRLSYCVEDKSLLPEVRKI